VEACPQVSSVTWHRYEDGNGWSDSVWDVRLAWTREEIVLAADLLIRSNYKHLPSSHEEVLELSRLLHKARVHPLETRDDNFRSPESVHRKMADIGTSDPEYAGIRTRGNRLDRQVLLEFQDHPVEMSELAKAIRRAFEEGVEPVSESDLDEFEAWEGRAVATLVRRLERNRALRERKLTSIEASGLDLACEACGFVFENAYGSRGERYIEIHHLQPLSVAGHSKTALEDLALLCANCHRMVHRLPFVSPQELRREMSVR